MTYNFICPELYCPYVGAVIFATVLCLLFGSVVFIAVWYLYKMSRNNNICKRGQWGRDNGGVESGIYHIGISLELQGNGNGPSNETTSGAVEAGG